MKRTKATPEVAAADQPTTPKTQTQSSRDEGAQPVPASPPAPPLTKLGREEDQAPPAIASMFKANRFELVAGKGWTRDGQTFYGTIALIQAYWTPTA